MPASPKELKIWRHRKQSLLSVIRLLSTNKQDKKTSSIKSGKMNEDKPRNNSDDQGNTLTANDHDKQNEAKHTENTSDKDKKNKKRRKNKKKTIKSKQFESKASSTSSAPSPTNECDTGVSTSQSNNDPKATIILGDSIIKRLNSWKLWNSTKSKVKVCFCPGAHVKDMYHYVVPSLDKAPDTANVVLHTETNDLREKSPKDVADAVADLVRHIESNYPTMKVSISETTTRCDSTDITTNVGEYNTVIEQFCKQ